jgi:DNA-binding transcriptional ArsR family regulator
VKAFSDRDRTPRRSSKRTYRLTPPRFYLTKWLNIKSVSRFMVIDQLSLTFAALADPTRRAILTRLKAGPTSVGELAEPHDMSLPAISKHLNVLERCGLIERAREAQWRPCQLKAAPLKAAVDWLELYRRHWEESFDRLDDYLQELQTKKRTSKGNKNHARKKKRHV